MTYDIRNPKRWRKVYELMKGYGERLQLSVFRCSLNDRDREKLRWELAQVMAEEDTLLVIGLCGGCVERVRAINPKEGWPEEPAPFRVLWGIHVPWRGGRGRGRAWPKGLEFQGGGCSLAYE